MVKMQLQDKQISNLFSMTSHELRTPLATIKEYIAMLLTYDRKLKRHEKHEYLMCIDEITDRLTELVNYYLDMSRSEAMMTKLEKKRTSISKIITEVLAEARLRAPGHKIVLQLENRLPMVTIDAKRIHQVFENIIDNAIKYSEKGSTIVIQAQRVKDQLLISVCDQGVGIPEGELERVFNRMYRVEQRVSSGTAGVGLGLAICKGLVEEHGGHIWMESEQGKGTTCSFTLPL